MLNKKTYKCEFLCYIMIKKEKTKEKDLLQISKNFLSKEELKKIAKIKNKKERADALSYFLYSKFKSDIHDFEILLDKNRRNIKDVGTLVWYLDLAKHRIGFFQIEPTKDNFYKVISIFNKIKKMFKDGSI